MGECSCAVPVASQAHNINHHAWLRWRLALASCAVPFSTAGCLPVLQAVRGSSSCQTCHAVAETGRPGRPRQSRPSRKDFFLSDPSSRSASLSIGGRRAWRVGRQGRFRGFNSAATCSVHGKSCKGGTHSAVKPQHGISPKCLPRIQKTHLHHSGAG